MNAASAVLITIVVVLSSFVLTVTVVVVSLFPSTTEITIAVTMPPNDNTSPTTPIQKPARLNENGVLP